jgi:1-pyrroline-5-carboxylate dehydrogenase
MRPSFQNEPTFDFGNPATVAAFQSALDAVRGKLGAEYPMWIGGKAQTASKTFASTSPADPATVIGVFPSGDASTAAEAIGAATAAFPAWKKVPPEERANYLFALAGSIRKRRMELCAWLVWEVGKSWDEADGEVAECVDLVEYYALQMLEYAGTQTARLGRLPNESSDFFYIPLGAGVIISPWNFPLALSFGPACGAIVAGNTVVLKPASNTPTAVSIFAQMIRETGFPDGVFNLVTGSGAALGNALVDDPRTRFVGFTGSMEVGIAIHERAAKVHPGQIWLKRVVLEMGGKNAVIVDSEADIDAAAEGAAFAGFSFQGQKCSAGSRVIIDESVYDEFMEKYLKHVSVLKVGDPVTDVNINVGPVIDASAHRTVLKYLEIGKNEATLLTGGSAAGDKGYFVQPTVFGNVSPTATIAQEEIFGPVTACIKAKDFTHALEIANSTKFGLTGAVFSRNRQKLEIARHEFHTGNLYFNRKCTGAMMGVHPFGGFNMSGTDSKAGGPDYLLLFLQGKSIGDRLF